MEFEIDRNGNVKSRATGLGAVTAQAEVLGHHIRSNLLIRVGLYALAALFVVTASILIVLAPEGRQTEVTVVALALFVLAIGAAGFSTFALKAPGFEVAGGDAKEREGG